MKSEDHSQGEFILPSFTVNELEKLPKTGDKLYISFTDRQVAIDLKVNTSEEEDQGFRNSVYLVSKVVEGKYPNYKQVIPKDDFTSSLYSFFSISSLLLLISVLELSSFTGMFSS